MRSQPFLSIAYDRQEIEMTAMCFSLRGTSLVIQCVIFSSARDLDMMSNFTCIIQGRHAYVLARLSERHAMASELFHQFFFLMEVICGKTFG